MNPKTIGDILAECSIDRPVKLTCNPLFGEDVIRHNIYVSLEQVPIKQNKALVPVYPGVTPYELYGINSLKYSFLEKLKFFF